MANTFKSYTTGSVGTTLTNVHAVGASTSSIVLGCSVSNTTTSPIQASIKLNNNDGDNVFVVKEAPIPVGSSIEVMAGNKIVLNIESSGTIKPKKILFLIRRSQLWFQ